MATLQDLKDRRDRLKAQKHSGVARVTFEGRTVDYRGLAEINLAIADLDLLIGQQEGGKVTRHIRIFADKGL